MTDSSKGTLAAIVAFSLWGVLPVFWKALGAVPVLELTAHRVVWTLVVLIIYTLSLHRQRVKLG